jgi:hypothetical protein
MAVDVLLLVAEKAKGGTSPMNHHHPCSHLLGHLGVPEHVMFVDFSRVL